MAPPPATRAVPVGDHRVMTLDDVGDPDGAPVLYLHGTPDSRLARHPDDGLAAHAGVRLLAIDRPGYGGSSPPAAAPWSPTWPQAVAADVARVLDAEGVDRCAVLAWSGGALTGLALAGDAADGPLAGRIGALGIVAGLVPRQAYDDPDVRAAADSRTALVEMAEVVPPGELAAEVAPLLAPAGCDLALAAEHQAGERSAADAAELASVVGGVERMAEALVEAVRPGLAGVEADVEAQARLMEVDLTSLTCPVHLWYGADDLVAPPAFGRWYEGHLPDATLTVVDGAGHYVAFTHWSQALTTLAAAVGFPAG